MQTLWHIYTGTVVLCLTIIQIGESSADVLDASMTTIFVKAREGTPVVIPCPCLSADDGPSRRAEPVTWSKIGADKSLVVSMRGRGNGKVEVGRLWDKSRVTLNGTSLVIGGLQYPRDNGRFICDSDDSLRDVTITVLAPVQLTSILGVEEINGAVRLAVSDGELVRVSCKASGNPTPTFQWTLDSGPIPRAKFPNSSDPNLSIVEFTPTRASNGKVIKCSPSNGLGNAVQRAAYLWVVFPPEDISLTVSPKSLTLKEGESVVFRCNAKGRPTPKYLWERHPPDGAPIRLSSASSRYRIRSVTASDGGVYRCSASNTEGSLSETISITVLHAPTLTVTFDPNSLTLTCEANSRDVTFGDWERQLNGRLINTMKGDVSGRTSTLQLSSLTFNDTGNYSCSAKNSINSSKTSFYIQAKTKPIFPSKQLRIHSENYPYDYVKVDILFYSHPAPYMVQWLRESGSQRKIINKKFKYTLRQEPWPVRFTFHNVSAEILGTKATLEIHNLKRSDTGRYSLSIGNNLGLSEFWFYVQIKYPKYGQQKDNELLSPPLKWGLIIGGGGVLLILVVFTVLMIYHRRKLEGDTTKSRKKYMAEKSQPLAPESTEKADESTFQPNSPTDAMLKGPE